MAGLSIACSAGASSPQHPSAAHVLHQEKRPNRSFGDTGFGTIRIVAGFWMSYSTFYTWSRRSDQSVRPSARSLRHATLDYNCESTSSERLRRAVCAVYLTPLSEPQGEALVTNGSARRSFQRLETNQFPSARSRSCIHAISTVCAAITASANLRTSGSVPCSSTTRAMSTAP